MKSYMSYYSLLKDIEKFSEENDFLDAEKLIAQARAAIGKDLRNKGEPRAHTHSAQTTSGVNFLN